MPDLIAACFISFCLGVIAFTGINRVVKVNHGKRQETGKGLVERIGVMNLILILVGIALLAFTEDMKGKGDDGPVG